MNRCRLLVALAAGLVFPAVSHASLLTFSVGSGFSDPAPAETVDGVNITFSAGLAAGGGANNPSATGGVDGTRGGFLNNVPNGEINFDTDVVISSLYLRPQGGPTSQDPPLALPTLVGNLGGVEQWRIGITERSTDWIKFMSATTGDFSLAVDQLVYSQPAASNTNRIDDITFTAVPEPSTVLYVSFVFAGLATRRRRA